MKQILHIEQMYNYSNGIPVLINNKTIRKINKAINEIIINNKSTSDTFIDWTKTFYINYIKPNILAFVIIILICLFLFIRYYLKNYNKKNKYKKYYTDRNRHNEHNYHDHADKFIINNDELTNNNMTNVSNETNNETINNYDKVYSDVFDNVFNNDAFNDNTQKIPVSNNQIVVDNDINSLLIDDESDIYNQGQKYRNELETNPDLVVSNEMLNDLYNKKMSQLSFNDLSKLINS